MVNCNVLICIKVNRKEAIRQGLDISKGVCMSTSIMIIDDSAKQRELIVHSSVVILPGGVLSVMFPSLVSFYFLLIKV